MKNETRNWSPQQQEIFSWFEKGTGNLVVRARAGTGKTTTIITAIEYAPEKKVLLAAFNKRIATELQAKLTRDGADAKTLHSVGFTFVLQNWPGVRVDDERGFKLAKAALGGSFVPNGVARLVANIASKAKGMAPFASREQLEDIMAAFDLFPDDEMEEQGFNIGRIAKAAQDAMDAATRPNANEGASIDFDDMVFVPVRNGWARGKYDLVVIDEAQDMNASQLILAQRVCKKGGRVAVVGDDRQAIYAFRGADSQSIDRLKTELQALELGLTITYRCPQKVVQAAQAIVPDYQAAPTAPQGVISNILEAQLSAKAGPGDYVLSRKNAPLVRHCLAMLRTGKRARIEGRDIGAGLLALVRKLKARDLVSLTKKLGEWEQKEGKKVLAAKGGDQDAAAPKLQQLADTKETLLVLADGLSTVAELDNRIQQLFSDVGTGQVVFSSVHKAKGLEAERVFLIEESFKRKAKGAETAEFSQSTEEQNIRYVAITRAKQELVWVKATPLDTPEGATLEYPVEAKA